MVELTENLTNVLTGDGAKGGLGWTAELETGTVCGTQYSGRGRYVLRVLGGLDVCHSPIVGRKLT